MHKCALGFFDNLKVAHFRLCLTIEYLLRNAKDYDFIVKGGFILTFGLET